MSARETHTFLSNAGNQGFVTRGHNIPDVEIDQLAEAELGPLGAGEWWRVEERYFSMQPRVIWCERYGEPCDYNGEDWHAHWHSLKPNSDEDTHWTEVWRERDA